VGDKAFAPLANRVTVAIEQLGKLLIGGIIVGRGMEDQTTAERQGLGRRSRADQRLELFELIRGKCDTRRKRPWHDVPPCTRIISEASVGVIMAAVSTFVQRLAADL
jgi:hypothetical protein